MIFLECFTDVFLFKQFGVGRKKIRHEGTKGKVLEKVEKESGNVVGAIDEDPWETQPKQLRHYVVVEEHGSIKLLVRRNNEKKKLIIISPRLEEWLMQRAIRKKINPRSFNLPDKAKKLHSIDVRKNKKYQAFIKAVIQGNDEITAIREWIKEAKSDT